MLRPSRILFQPKELAKTHKHYFIEIFILNIYFSLLKKFGSIKTSSFVIISFQN